MAVSRWARFVRHAPVPVFVAAGVDGWGPAQELRGVPRIQLAATPRHATVLLVAGTVPEAHLEALRRVHDQRPHPRVAVTWRPAGAALQIPAAHGDGDLDALVAALDDAFARVTADPATTAGDLLPDVDPVQWRGVGPFGQGGEGMMGGTPYGRPMAMTGDDRDGLALDQLHLTLGPFLDALPPGLELDVVLQGEVVQQITPRRVAADADDAAVDPWLPADAALADARRGLRWLAHALHVEGLDALAARAARLASRVTDDVDRVAVTADAATLARHIRRTGVLRTLPGAAAATAGNNAARSLDVAAHWRTRMDAIVAALRDGRSPAASLDPDLMIPRLVGMTITDATSVIVGLGVDGPRAHAVAPS